MEISILSNIESLPPLPKVITQLQELCSKSDVTLKEVVQLIEQDPFLVANIIKIANSPLYGHVKQVKTLSFAVSLFGIASIKGIAIASALKSSFVPNFSPYGLDTQQFYDTTEARSAFLYQWYCGDKKLEVLIPSVVLMHIGNVVIADYLIKTHKDKEFYEKISKADFKHNQEIEKQMLGMDCFEVLKELLKKWNFEENMIDVITAINSKDILESLKEYVYPLRVVNSLITPYYAFTQEQIQEAYEKVKEYNLPLEAFLNVLNKHKLSLK
ncbi:HDOD domain-containing protein [Helicobacter burdigaliensis]|uniref:HDOD domain-containing protein n=1 Tax=Helicobacter burdigaliensis TaxID=2315334 RepID=UPI000EF6F59D|nr:HDOD domain-containing protein [Helicobacter burdigaliensis]